MILVNEPLRRKLHGIHYTPKILADHLASRMLEYLPGNPESLKVVDPAVGDGELLSALVRVCIGRGIRTVAEGFDTDENAVISAENHLKRLLPSDHVQISVADFLDQALEPVRPTLFSRAALPGSADLIIANPPYIRTQALGAIRAQEMAGKFGLSGRVDIYQAFVKAISWSLSPGGIAGLIISNRFMSVRAGSDIRAYLLRHFDVLEVWDLGDTRIFEAAVLPAVLILRKNDNPSDSNTTIFKSVYRSDISGTGVAKDVKNVCDALGETGYVRTTAGDVLQVRQGQLDHGTSSTGVWRISTESSKDWLKTVLKNTFCRFSDVGKIRVGVKSTGDSVYLRKDWSEETPELLRLVTTHHVARSYHPHEVKRRILYPHTFEDGKRKAVDLDLYPISKSYLEKHRRQLEDRTYVMSAGRKWFELWVPQSPEMWVLPKVVFRDIAEKPTFWMDLDGTVVNGDCYWIVSECGDSEMLWLLLAVSNSRFIEDFYDHRFNNKLYAGRRRFMTQYVETFPLPDPKSAIARAMIKRVKLIYEGLASGMEVAKERERLEEDVYKSFGLHAKEAAVSLEEVSEVFGSRYFPQSA
jgi:adenine-specific DNA-methyltransferase